jgi:hypothetical protein
MVVTQSGRRGEKSLSGILARRAHYDHSLIGRTLPRLKGEMDIRGALVAENTGFADVLASRGAGRAFSTRE